MTRPIPPACECTIPSDDESIHLDPNCPRYNLNKENQ